MRLKQQADYFIKEDFVEKYLYGELRDSMNDLLSMQKIIKAQQYFLDRLEADQQWKPIKDIPIKLMIDERHVFLKIEPSEAVVGHFNSVKNLWFNSDGSGTAIDPTHYIEIPNFP